MANILSEKTKEALGILAMICTIVSIIGAFIYDVFYDDGLEPYSINNTFTYQPTFTYNADCDCHYEDERVEVNGHIYTFRIAYLSQEMRWKYASHDSVETGLAKNRLKNEFLKIPQFEKAKGVIALGVSSQEGEADGEFDRADRRADVILLVLRTLEAVHSKSLYKLNLGRHKEQGNLTEMQTSSQRRVIVIGIMEQKDNASVSVIERALREGLNDSEGVQFNTTRYSDFVFTKMN